jgi:hypothetical protein
MLNILAVFPELVPCLAIMLAAALRGLFVLGDQWRTNWLILIAAVQVPLQILVAELLHGLSVLRPMKYDLILCRLDMVFGSPSFALGRFAAHHTFFANVLGLVYVQLTVAMILAVAVNLWAQPRAEAIRIIVAFFITFPIAVPFYLALPVCGPAFAFPAFPFVDPPHSAMRLIALDAAPNGFPSIHMASAILVFWYLRQWKAGRLAGSAFLLLTALSTLATGQHYFIDIVFAFPYAIMIHWLSFKLVARRGKHSSRKAALVAQAAA